MNPTELSAKERKKKGLDLSEFSIHKEHVDTKNQMPIEENQGNDDAASQARGSAFDGPAGTILELLKSLEKKLPKARKRKVTSELQNWVRLLEAGSSGEHAKEYEEEISRACVEVMDRFESILPSTTEFLKAAAKKEDADRNGYIAEALKALSADRFKSSSDASGPQRPDNEIDLPMAEAFISHFDSDLPLGDSAVDCINVEDEARAFARIAASRDVSPPLAVGIFGEWGSAKGRQW